jgi:hypothetical protein
VVDVEVSRQAVAQAVEQPARIAVGTHHDMGGPYAHVGPEAQRAAVRALEPRRAVR